ncbi:MAG: class I SAM-dependent methyltransferase [Dehalococcoidia bacterium]|nr:MAG: class I SAM-dependent methyltransferase [Dehalococcoidia bacterium]
MSNQNNSPESPPSAFDAIAPAWYNIRHHTIFKVELEALSQRWGKGDLLNLGCGHGADFLPFKSEFKLFGVDYSAGMLQLARKFAQKHGFEVKLSQADLRQLPYPNACFDWAIAVASLHHLKGHSAQLKALVELRRVLNPGGEAFVTVWNKWQPRFWFKPKEALIPFKIGDEIIQRYYYLFSYGEIERLARQAGFEILKSSPESRYHFPVRSFSRNICLLLKKTN